MAKQDWKPGNMLYPVPAVMVTCQKAGEKPNIITVAWAGTVCTNPPMVSISVRRERHSYAILKESGEFVINLTTAQLVRAADYCGVRSGRDVDKFREAGLSPCCSKAVSCPGIAQSPVNIECRITEIKPLGSHDLFLAEVVNVSVDSSLLDEAGSLQLSRSGLVSYVHGGYFGLGSKLGTFGYSVKKKTAGRKTDGTRKKAGNKKITVPGNKARNVKNNGGRKGKQARQ